MIGIDSLSKEERGAGRESTDAQRHGGDDGDDLPLVFDGGVRRVESSGHQPHSEHGEERAADPSAHSRHHHHTVRRRTKHVS